MHSFLTYSFCLLSFFSFSQNENDLFRHSKTTYHGSARFEAMGGSFGALGADLSSYQINPAGYGRFSSSQFGTSIFGGASSNTSVFNSVSTKAVQGQGGLSNLGIVLTNDVSENGEGFLFNQFGFGYNQIESFKNEIRYEGQQYSSLLDNFVSQIQGFYSEFYSHLNAGDVYHNRSITTKGGINEVYFNLSGNYINKLYLGANVSIRSYRYIEDYTHSESLVDTTGTDLRSFDYNYYLKTKGNVMNIRLVAIYLVNEAVRFGLALHSPTFSEMTDIWSAGMTSRFSTNTYTVPDSLIPTGDYKYKVRTPARVVGSVAFVFGTKGCLNIDLEYLSYRQAHFKSTSDLKYEPYNYDFENKYAKEIFQDALNLRNGGVYVVFAGFFIRGGCDYYGNAFNAAKQLELKPDLIISGGIGFKTKKFTLDISYRQRTNQTTYYAFSNSLTTIANSTGNAIISGLINF